MDLGYALGFLLPTLSNLARDVIGLDRASPEVRSDLPSDFWQDQRFEGYSKPMMARELLKAELGGIRNVSLVRGDARSIPLGTESVDRVFCLGLLEHTQDPDRVILEIRRILKPGGVAVFALPVEFGMVLLSRTLAGTLLGVMRDSYSPLELLESIIWNRPPSNAIRDDTTHRGYDYRHDAALIGEHLRIERVRRFPTPVPGLNSLVIMSGRK